VKYTKYSSCMSVNTSKFSSCNISRIAGDDRPTPGTRPRERRKQGWRESGNGRGRGGQTEGS
jgi:hypothetical protein